MKNLIYILLLILTYSCKEAAKDYSGNWMASGDSFENNLVLEKISNQKDAYKFSFYGWRESYDIYTRQKIKFPGSMFGDFFTIEINEGKAYYSDDSLIEEGEYRIYEDGEERCKLFFEFNYPTIKVKSTDCNLIYGGSGVLFDGYYKKVE
jgi:hypothetical protein